MKPEQVIKKRRLEQHLRDMENICFWKMDMVNVCLNSEFKYQHCRGTKRDCVKYVSNKDVRDYGK